MSKPFNKLQEFKEPGRLSHDQMNINKSKGNILGFFGRSRLGRPPANVVKKVVKKVKKKKTIVKTKIVKEPV